MSRSFANSSTPVLDVITDCLAPGTYIFVINDNYGDLGYNGSVTSWATYNLKVNGVQVLNLTSCPCDSCTNRSCKEYKLAFVVS